MIESINFYPIGDDEPDCPTCAVLNVMVYRYSPLSVKRCQQEVTILNRSEVVATLKRLNRSLDRGNDVYRVRYDGDGEYSYLVDSHTAMVLVDQLDSILLLM